MTETTGLVHIYYGDGKGKTTAAFGLAFRCAGRGQRTVVAQFLKGGASGEVTATERFPEITLFRGKSAGKFTYQMNDAEKAVTAVECQHLFQEAATLARDAHARLLVLDEGVDACAGGFLPIELLIEFLDSRPQDLEVVLTGHSLPEALGDRADYITCMAKEKHPFDRGIRARPDIEF